MGILPLKKRVNRDKCSFATKQRMFGVFAIDEILRYRGTRFPGSRTLCHPDLHIIISKNIHRDTFSFSHCIFLTLVNSNSNSRQSCNVLVSANASPLKNRALQKSLTSRHFNLTQSLWLACKPFTFLYRDACFFFSFFLTS